mgnify:CR=1 FL=1
MANWKWRYRTTDGFLPGGCGNLPNGFSADELDPVSPNMVQESITEAQAQARCGNNGRNKGIEAAAAAIAMLNLMSSIGKKINLGN